MSRPRSTPRYRRHKQSGQAVVTLTDPTGRRRDVLLGKHGTKASRDEYNRILQEWETAGQRLPTAPDAADLTVSELALAFLEHAKKHYRRPDGTPTSEVVEFRMSLRAVLHLYGPTAASDFGPLALKAVRDLMVKGYAHPRYGPQPPLSRGVINQRIGRLRRVWKWGAENEMVPATVLLGLQAVRGLQRGRTEARETEPVGLVAEAVVEDTLPYLPRPVAGIVRLLLWTGMRVGECVLMRPCDIDTSGAVWLYRPPAHKTAHHGHSRVVAIGPHGQAVIKEFLTLDTQAYLFCPAREDAQRRAAQRRERRTRVPPSQVCRAKKRPRRKPGQHYITRAVNVAVQRGIGLANRARACPACKPLAPAERCPACQANAVPHWHVHQLRHTAATRIRREYGLDVARVVLGHRSAAVTAIYAEADTGRAAEVMAKLG